MNGAAVVSKCQGDAAAVVHLPQAAEATDGVKDARELVCELCRNFYDLGWCSGTGGSISIKHGNCIFMAPSGVQKERMQPADIFVLDSAGTVMYSPPATAGTRVARLHNSIWLSSCLWTGCCLDDDFLHVLWFRRPLCLPAGRPALKLSQCAPLFQLPFRKRNAGACIHSHSMSVFNATLIDSHEFRVTHMEMIKVRR